MTEDERKKAIKDALKKLREDIQSAQNTCAEAITPHLVPLGLEVEEANEFDICEAVEKAAGLDTENFFSSVSYTIDSLCTDILWNLH